MPSALIVGFPKGIVHRIRDARKCGCEYRTGWKITSSSSPAKSFDTNISDVQGALRQFKGDGPHVLAFKSSKREHRDWLHANVVPYFRFRWLENSWITDPDTQNIYDLIPLINNVLEEEECWSEHVKPQGVSSPLLIPEKCFSARTQVRELWDDAKTSDVERIDSVVKKINRFREFHEQKRDEDGRRVWVDQSTHQFDWQGERHGEACYPRCWKYSFAIPDGFHFDVRSAKGCSISMEGSDHRICSNKYLNVDPHGYIR